MDHNIITAALCHYYYTADGLGGATRADKAIVERETYNTIGSVCLSLSTF